MKKVLSNCFYMFLFLYKYCKKYVLFSFLVAILSSINSILSIYFIRVALNVATQESSLTKLLYFLVVQSIILILFSIINSGYQGKIVPVSQQNFQKEMHSELFLKAAVISVTKYDDPEFYDKYVLALNNSDSRALSILDTFTTLIHSLFTIMGIIAIITSLDRLIFLFVILNVVISLSLNTILSKISYRLNVELTHSRRGMSYIQRIYYLRDYANELRLTKITDCLKTMYKGLNHTAILLLKESGHTKTKLYFLQSFLQVLYASGIMVYLSFRLFSKAIAAGDFAALINSANQLSNSLKGLFQVGPKLYEHSLYINNFREFIEYEAPNQSGDRQFHQFNDLKLQNVSFRYGNTNKDIIHGFSLSLEKGSKIALVGANGAGKSTLAKMIVGLYEPQQGNVLFNSLPQHEYIQDDFLQKVGIIFQDFRIYAVSIIENILMRPIKNEHEDEKAVIAALTKVGLYEKIVALPNGIYTNLTRELDGSGAIFSRGEVQRIVIARAFVTPYELLVLDEPSSSLDAISEAEIFRLILEEYSERTVIIISHRLANIRYMDQIYYIENGGIAETGTHEELMKRNGLYAELYKAKL